MGGSLIRTIGHGTSSADGFAQLVTGAGIETIVDVRRFPGSRRHPHFGADAMSEWLNAAGVQYLWLPALGGRRKGAPASPNLGLRNPQFRAYADHMASTEFRSGVEELLDLASARPAAVMCSESVWWRCHRRLLADHLVLVAACRVEHLFHDGRLALHPVMEAARRVDDHVTYEAVSHERPEGSPSTP